MKFDTSVLQALFSLGSTFFGAQVKSGPVVFQNLQELPQGVEYDFVIVGGGTAGAVVASRLAENLNFNILVIEAGPWHENIFAARVPGLFLDLRKTNVDWNYTTIPQVGLNGRSLFYSRGKMLGGCSSHNNMAYTRGSKDDWDRWAKIVGDEGFSWDRMFPFMLKAEKLVEDSEKQSEEGHIDPTFHGYKGKVSVTAPYSEHPFSDMLMQSTQELKDEFPYKLDMNDGQPIGIGWNQFTIDHNAERSSSATAYIEKTGRNVHVLVNTHVTRVLPIHNHTDFRGVEFAADSQSTRRQITAKKEIIMSAGVIGTPQVLLNSGIGNREELEVLGIKTIVNNPSVGKNLTDHPMVQIAFETTIPDTDYDRETALAEWNRTRTGPLALPSHLNHLIWVRLPEDATPFSQDGFSDPTGGNDSPHIEMVPLQISSRPPPVAIELPAMPPGLVMLQLMVSNLNPISRGSVTLNNSNPFIHPNIDFNLLSEEVDMAIMREAIRSARRLYSAPVFQDRVYGMVLPGGNVTSDEDLDTYIRSVAATFTHGVGSAAMSPRDASWGVVDPDLRVKGTNGLRIVDASIFPFVPSGHTQAPVYGIAERASELISAAWE